MNRILLLLSFVLLLLPMSGAQTADEMAVRSNRIQEKMRQIDLLAQILPLAMTKEQIRKLLPPIEKVRQSVRAIVAEEAKQLAAQEAKVDEAVKAGLEKGVVPPLALIRELGKMTNGFALKRKLVTIQNLDYMVPIVESTLNEGQKKVAAESLSVAFYEPTVKPEQVTEKLKLQIFIREILLDPSAYDVLVKLSI